MTTKIKRSEVATFMDTTPDSTPTYSRIGDGVTTGLINYNPQVSTETYIDEDSATITVEGYAPTMPIEAVAKASDAVFEFVDGLRKARAILSDAETTIVNVWMYESGGPTAYPAEQQAVSIQIDTFGGDGGQAAKISYTVNFIGDPVAGTFNASNSTFTPS